MLDQNSVFWRYRAMVEAVMLPPEMLLRKLRRQNVLRQWVAIILCFALSGLPALVFADDYASSADDESLYYDDLSYFEELFETEEGGDDFYADLDEDGIDDALEVMGLEITVSRTLTPDDSDYWNHVFSGGEGYSTTGEEYYASEPDYPESITIEETITVETDPTLKDSDKDGWDDLSEWENGFNPIDDADGKGDWDDDGLTNSFETAHNYNFKLPDSNYDGISDFDDYWGTEEPEVENGAESNEFPNSLGSSDLSSAGVQEGLRINEADGVQHSAGGRGELVDPDAVDSSIQAGAARSLLPFGATGDSSFPKLSDMGLVAVIQKEDPSYSGPSLPSDIHTPTAPGREVSPYYLLPKLAAVLEKLRGELPDAQIPPEDELNVKPDPDPAKAGAAPGAPAAHTGGCQHCNCSKANPPTSPWIFLPPPPPLEQDTNQSGKLKEGLTDDEVTTLKQALQIDIEIPGIFFSGFLIRSFSEANPPTFDEIVLHLRVIYGFGPTQAEDVAAHLLTGEGIAEQGTVTIGEIKRRYSESTSAFIAAYRDERLSLEAGENPNDAESINPSGSEDIDFRNVVDPKEDILAENSFDPEQTTTPGLDLSYEEQEQPFDESEENEISESEAAESVMRGGESESEAIADEMDSNAEGATRPGPESLDGGDLRQNNPDETSSVRSSGSASAQTPYEQLLSMLTFQPGEDDSDGDGTDNISELTVFLTHPSDKNTDGDDYDDDQEIGTHAMPARYKQGEFEGSSPEDEEGGKLQDVDDPVNFDDPDQIPGTPQSGCSCTCTCDDEHEEDDPDDIPDYDTGDLGSNGGYGGYDDWVNGFSEDFDSFTGSNDLDTSYLNSDDQWIDESGGYDGGGSPWPPEDDDGGNDDGGCEGCTCTCAAGGGGANGNGGNGDGGSSGSSSGDDSPSGDGGDGDDGSDDTTPGETYTGPTFTGGPAPLMAFLKEEEIIEAEGEEPEITRDDIYDVETLAARIRELAEKLLEEGGADAVRALAEAKAAELAMLQALELGAFFENKLPGGNYDDHLAAAQSLLGTDNYTDTIAKLNSIKQGQAAALAGVSWEILVETGQAQSVTNQLDDLIGQRRSGVNAELVAVNAMLTDVGEPTVLRLNESALAGMSQRERDNLQVYGTEVADAANRMREVGNEATAVLKSGVDFASDLLIFGVIEKTFLGQNAMGEDIGVGERMLAAVSLIPVGRVVGGAGKVVNGLKTGTTVATETASGGRNIFQRAWDWVFGGNKGGNVDIVAPNRGGIRGARFDGDAPWLPENLAAWGDDVLLTNTTTITSRGMTDLTSHLESLEAIGDPINKVMIERLHAIRSGKTKGTVADFNFYNHELREKALMRQLGEGTDGYYKAHYKALKDFGISLDDDLAEQALFPSSVRALPDF